MEDNQSEKPKKSINFLIYIFIAIVVGVSLIFILSKNSDKQEEVNATETKQAESVSPSPISTESKDSQDNNEVKIVEVETGSFYYKPNEIKIKKGEKVKIVLKSVSILHDFNIDELNIRIPIVKTGDTGVVEFTADRVGNFEYYCSVGNHRQMGQVGKIIVE